MRHCLAEAGSGRKVESATKVALSNVKVTFGEVECAAIQTVHVAVSSALEW